VTNEGMVGSGLSDVGTGYDGGRWSATVRRTLAHTCAWPNNRTQGCIRMRDPDIRHLYLFYQINPVTEIVIQ